jgi:hypothetical protein
MDDLTDEELNEIANSGDKMLAERNRLISELYTPPPGASNSTKLFLSLLSKHAARKPFRLSPKDNFVLAIGLPAISIGLLALLDGALHLPDFFGWLLVGLLAYSIIRPFFSFFTKK